MRNTMGTGRDGQGGRPPSIEQRLAALEQENRRLRGAMVVAAPVLGLAVLAIVLGQASISCAQKQQGAPTVSNALQTRRLEVVNEKGTPVVVVSADSRGWGRLVTYRDDGQQQLVQLAATDDGGTIAVAGARGQLRAAMAVADKDDGTVFTFDGRNTRLIALSKSALGDGAVMSYDRAGNIKKMWP